MRGTIVLREGLACAAHGQITVPDPAQGNEPVCQLLHLSGLTSNNNYFRAIIMVHVDMGGRDNMVMKIMLSVGHFFLKFRLMVVKDQADDPHYLFIRLPLLLDHSLADQIPDGFWTVVILVGLDISVKLIKQAFFEGIYRKSFEHFFSTCIVRGLSPLSLS